MSPSDADDTLEFGQPYGTPPDSPVPTEPATPDQPDTIGKYHILGKLGEGGMGVVWEAEQDRPRRKVALKIVRGGRFVDDVSLRLFQREAESLGRLDHPAIAGIYEAGTTKDGQHYFAMELVEGPTLEEYLQRPGLQPSREEFRRRLELFRRICEAVHYAHQRGVIHRDLKPSNLVVVAGESEADAPQIKVLDFGLARITDPDAEGASMRTEVGTVRGTLAYMSPEQIRGEPDAIDVRSDVYALGVVLYMVLKGSLPYDVSSSSIVTIARVICEEPPAPLREGWVWSRHPDPDLETILRKAIEKEPGDRYESASSLAEDVGRYLTNQPILARPPSTAYQLKKLVARNKLPFAAAVAFIALLIGFGAWMTVLYRQSEAAERRASAEAEKAKQVSEFLVNTFEVVDPNEARGNTITAREILDRGAKKVRTSLADQPLVQADLMETMGRVYKGLGLYPESRDLLEDGIHRLEQHVGSDHLDLAAPLVELGLLLSLQGDYTAARESVHRAIVIRERELGVDHPRVVATRFQLAGILDELGEHDEAGEIFEKDFDTYLQAVGEESLQGLTAWQSYALHAWRIRDPETALARYEKTLALAEQILPEDHPTVMAYAENIASALNSLDRMDEAVPFIERAVESRRKTLGSDHPQTLKTIGNLAITRGELGDDEGAEELFVELQDRMLAKHGPDHPEYARTIHNLGYHYLKTGMLDQAREPLEEALRIREAAFGETHLSISMTAWCLASLHRELGNYEQSKRLLERTIAIDEELLGADHPDVAADLDDYAVLLRLMGRTAQADAASDRAARIRETHAAARETAGS